MEKVLADKNLFPCPRCWKSFARKKYLNQHIKFKHKERPEKKKTNIRCPDEACDFKCYKHVDLRLHTAFQHSLVLEEVTTWFPTVTDFRRWKKQEEMSAGCFFAKHTSGKRVGRDVIKEYYRCHSSQSYSPSALKKLLQKKELSDAAVISCPATIEAQKMVDGTVQVVYYKTHFGHQVQEVAPSKVSADDDYTVILDIPKKNRKPKKNLYRLKPTEKKSLPQDEEMNPESPPSEPLPKLVKSEVISKLKYAALLAECTTTSDDTVAKIDRHINKVIEILQEAHVRTFEAEAPSDSRTSNQPNAVMDHSYASALQKYYNNSVSELFDHSYALDLQDLDQGALSPLPCFDHSYALDFQEFEHSYASDFDVMKV